MLTFDEQVNQSIISGLLKAMPILCRLFVGQKLLHQWIDVLEATNPSSGWIPVAIVDVINQFGQGQKQTEMIVDFSRWTEFLQIAEYFDHFFDSSIDIGNQSCFRFDAQKLDVFLTKDEVVKSTGVESC